MHTDDTATGELRREHQLILQVVNSLERQLDVAGDSPPASDELEDYITFFRLFTDACHHGKEEDVLFRELEEQGMPRDQGPIAVMLEEHRIGRRLVGRMADALDSLRGGEPAAWSTFAGAGRDYVQLLRQHIGKEDGVLFHMADQMVSGSACERVCERYAEVCAGRFEGRTLEDLERLAHEIEERTTTL